MLWRSLDATSRLMGLSFANNSMGFAMPWAALMPQWCTFILNITVDIKIVTVKTKVSPIKGQSFKWFELAGVLLVSKLANSTVSALKLDVDGSIPCLYYIGSRIISHGNSSFIIGYKTFGELQRIINGNRCMNPTDHLPSQEVNASEMMNSCKWWKGPAFLQLPPDKWP